MKAEIKSTLRKHGPLNASHIFEVWEYRNIPIAELRAKLKRMALDGELIHAGQSTGYTGPEINYNVTNGNDATNKR